VRSGEISLHARDVARDATAGSAHSAPLRTGHAITTHLSESPSIKPRAGAPRAQDARLGYSSQHIAPHDTPAADQRTIAGRNPLNGATVANLSPAKADELGIDPFVGPGVMVINPGAGFARNAGFRPGDMIREVNGREVKTVRDLASALASDTRGWRVTIQRGNRQISADFRT